jgi:hypothetical protein
MRPTVPAAIAVISALAPAESGGPHSTVKGGICMIGTVMQTQQKKPAALIQTVEPTGDIAHCAAGWDPGTTLAGAAVDGLVTSIMAGTRSTRQALQGLDLRPGRRPGGEPALLAQEHGTDGGRQQLLPLRRDRRAVIIRLFCGMRPLLPGPPPGSRHPPIGGRGGGRIPAWGAIRTNGSD